jgi:hypothetical protein
MLLLRFSLLVAVACASRLPAPLLRVSPTLVRSAVTMDATQKDEEEDRLGAGGRGGHAVPKQPELSEEERALQMRVMEHQKGAARLSMAEDARSLVAYSSGYAVLATQSSALEGYPSAALVGFAVDEAGLPVFCFSSMSSHTKDLIAAEKAGADSAKVSLCVTAKGFEGAADGRVTLFGDVKRCSKEEVEELGLREVYKTKHPNAFWADFGDFTYYRMHDLKAVNFVGGFARAARCNASPHAPVSRLLVCVACRGESRAHLGPPPCPSTSRAPDRLALRRPCAAPLPRSTSAPPSTPSRRSPHR